MLLKRRSTDVSVLPTCLRCGVESTQPEATFCRRCGLPYGAPPPQYADLPECPVCYREPEADGFYGSLVVPGRRVTFPEHRREHEQHPVGDDDWLETLREGDRVRVGRFRAPFDLVRRYLVTGLVDGGRTRRELHDAVVTAMTQLARWGAQAQVFGDQPEWAEAREAVESMMERFHRRLPH